MKTNAAATPGEYTEKTTVEVAIFQKPNGRMGFEATGWLTTTTYRDGEIVSTVRHKEGEQQ